MQSAAQYLILNGNGLPAATTETTTEEHVEDIHWAGESASTAATLFDRTLATLIVDCSFFGIGQHFVRL